MDAPPKHKLIKGPLRPPKLQPSSVSQTQKRASKDEVSWKRGKAKVVPVVEFDSQKTPQPFLDPSIIELRILEKRQWKIDQERKEKQAQASTSSDSGGASTQQPE